MPFAMSGRMTHAVETFFTTKEEDKGTGLGLATTYGIIKQHAGMIRVHSEPEQGTTFRIYLPAVHKGPGKIDFRGEEEIFRGGDETILVAEDSEVVRSIIENSLKKAGYRVILASNGEEAVALFNEHKKDIRLAFLDVVMPKLSRKIRETLDEAS